MIAQDDVARAIAAEDPQTADLLVRYLEQDDPEPGQPELGPDRPSDDDDDTDEDVPAAAFDLDALKSALAARAMRGKTATERKLARQEAFATAVASTYAPPRLRVGGLMMALYRRDDEFGRGVLLEVFARGRLAWGSWQAAKAIYKEAEARHDAAFVGVLGFRFDAMGATPYARQEIGAGTLVYLRRRVWRYLRRVGTAAPDAYPTFAVEVLRHYPADHDEHGTSWVAAQIWNHGRLRGARDAVFAPPDEDDALEQRAFAASWALSPAPLLRLLEGADNEQVCDFAIRCLRHDHPLALRAVEPAWLARLARRPIAIVHTLVVALLGDNPALHQSQLRALGLHEVVLGFLRSPSPEARSYALAYAAAHGDLGPEALVGLVEDGAPEVQKFAAARLEALTPAELGLDGILRLIGHAAAPWAAARLAQGFAPDAIDAARFVDAAARGPAALDLLVKFFDERRVVIPAGHWVALADDRRFESGRNGRAAVQRALAALAKRTAREIGIEWIQRALERRDRTDAIAAWLDAGMLSGADLDVAWAKRLVGKPRLRPIALELLGDRRRVAPAALGLGWLLELARAPEPALAQFAQRVLLESFEPADFADDEAAGGDAATAGLARLWALATGPRQPDAVRAFAATYLTAHHPVLGPRTAEARALGIKPRLDHAAYPLATVRPLLDDDRPDVRRLAVAIAEEELVRWADRGLVYALAGARHREPRALGAALLLSYVGAGPARLPADWLDGARVFQLAESAHKAAREVALTLIRQRYDELGGAERLAWLMDSPERDVRLFAVRLFWDRHRPRPDAPAPRKDVGLPRGGARFADLPALRQFARVVLFGLPPGRVGARDPIAAGGPRPERALPASVAKHRLIEALRDVALEDVALARAIAPLFGEFTHSTAKGEWQASVQALTALRARHGDEAIA